MASEWQNFVKQAQEIHPYYQNEKLIRNVLKSRGETTFESGRTDKLLKDLKGMISGWHEFLMDAKEIDEEFSNDNTVAKILNNYSIPWYSEFNITEGLKLLTEWRDNKLKTEAPWDYPCPICGKPTVRDHKFDHMYRRECDGLGWVCSENGYTHFHEAAWAPLKNKIVRFDPVFEAERQEVIAEGARKEMAEVNG